MRAHLITGVTGQDGLLLCAHLLAQGDRVIGVSRRAPNPLESKFLGGASLLRGDIRDTGWLAEQIRTHGPDSIINLAGVSSVAVSWQDPELNHAVNETAVRNLVQALGDMNYVGHFIQASSSEIFGPPDKSTAETTEDTPLNPQSPYAEAKARANESVQRARQDGLSASSLILFGHTSEYQPPSFVLPTVVRQALAVANGDADRVALDNPDIRRDWGSAHDVVRAFALALEAAPDDWVIASGKLHSLAEITSWALNAAGVPDTPLTTSGRRDRPRDFDGRVGVIAKANESLGWHPEIPLQDEIERMTRSGRADRPKISPRVGP